MDTLGNATEPAVADAPPPLRDPSHDPMPWLHQAMTTSIRLDPRVWRSETSGLIAILGIGPVVELSFTGATPDDQAVAAIDHLIDGLTAMRRLVVTLQSDESIIAAVAEQVAHG